MREALNSMDEILGNCAYIRFASPLDEEVSEWWRKKRNRVRERAVGKKTTAAPRR
jgi:hypothetical protein